MPPEVTNQPPPTGTPPPSPQPQAATLPPAYNGQWAGRGGIPGDTTLHTDFVLTLTGGEARAEVGTLQTETNGMPCRTSLQLVEVDADQVVLSGDCGGGDFIVLKVNGKNMDYYGGVQANTSWYAISASLRRR